MSITIKEVEHVARLARIALSDEEKKHFTEQLGRIIAYINQLSEVVSDTVEPMAHPVPVHDVYREDIVEKNKSTEALLAEAPEREGSFFKIQKIIE